MSKPVSIRLPKTRTTSSYSNNSFITSPTIKSPIKITRKCGSLIRASLIAILIFFLYLGLRDPNHFVITKSDHPRELGHKSYQSTNNPQSKQQIVSGASNDLPQRREKLHSAYAVAVKTGKETALNRVPQQLLTFLKDVDNIMFLGESANITIGDVGVEDVCTHLYDGYDEKPDHWQEALENLHKSQQTTRKIQKSDSLVPDEGSPGWKFDAHKNIPGFVKLYQKFPSAKWYIMIDDDTYLIFQNLDILLDQFSPDDEHYFGSDTMFTGCDNVKNFGEGPAFAHGTNFFINEKADPKYRDCWAGDVRTALCLRDNGILLQGQKHFNKEPPNAQFSYPADPCERPITFHHLLLNQMQKLHVASKRVVERKVMDSAGDSTMLSDGGLFLDLHTAAPTYGDIYAEFRDNSEFKAYEPDTNRVGSDYRSEAMTIAIDCQEACAIDSKCLAWTYDGGICWMKSNIPGAQEKQGAVSGTFPGKYKCPVIKRNG